MVINVSIISLKTMLVCLIFSLIKDWWISSYVTVGNCPKIVFYATWNHLVQFNQIYYWTNMHEQRTNTLGSLQRFWWFWTKQNAFNSCSFNKFDYSWYSWKCNFSFFVASSEKVFAHVWQALGIIVPEMDLSYFVNDYM